METMVALSNDKRANTVLSILLELGYRRERPIENADPRKVRFLVKDNIRARSKIDLFAMEATLFNKARGTEVRVSLSESMVSFMDSSSRFEVECATDALSMRRTEQNSDWDLDHAASTTSRGQYWLN